MAATAFGPAAGAVCRSREGWLQCRSASAIWL